MKFGEIPPHGLGGDVISKQLLTDTHPLIPSAQLEPVAQLCFKVEN